jgi:virginiamycin B lyase
LEGRDLPSTGAGTITIFPVPPGQGSFPGYIAPGPDGNEWFTETLGKTIGRITPTGAVKLIQAPDDVRGIAAGPDRNLWVAEEFGSAILRVTPSGSVRKFKIAKSFVDPVDITAGPDRAMWFVTAIFNKIGRITTTGLVTNVYKMPTGLSGTGSIATGPDGALWFTARGAIGRMTTSGHFSVFHLANRTGRPTDITRGPDGNLWFVEENTSKVGRITTSGRVTEFSLPTVGARPEGIVRGADGNLWFTENQGAVGRITVRGRITEYPVAGFAPDLRRIAAGPAGSPTVWFTKGLLNQIGQVTIA